MLQVLGIDPSLACTGISLTGESGEIFAMTFPTEPTKTLAEVRDRIRYIVGSVLRWSPAKELLTVIESPYVPQHASGQVLERAWLFGLLVDQLMSRGDVVAVTPSQRAKYGTGSGKADKKQVMAAVAMAFPNLPIRDHNEADAIVLASMGIRYLGAPIDGSPSKAQLDVMTAVRWPTR